MHGEAPRSAIAEWRRSGAVPIAAGIGYSTMAIQTYGVGPFVAPLEQEFGWSRAEIMGRADHLEHHWRPPQLRRRRSGGYDQMLILLMGLIGAGAAAIATMGRPNQDRLVAY